MEGEGENFRIFSTSTVASYSVTVEEDDLPIIHKDLQLRLQSLTELNLSWTDTADLPDALDCLDHLKILLLSHNKLTSLPLSIGCLKNLQKLNVSHNKLTNLPCSFASLNALELLDISHNNVAAPPHCLKVGCVRITFLDISYNHLEEWKEGPLCAHALESLNCQHNKLHINPSWIWGNFCRSLRNLNLSFNFFKNPAYMIRSYTMWRTGVSIELKSLNLCNCGFTSNDIHLVHQLKAIRCLMLGNEGRELDTECLLKKRGNANDNFIWEISFKPFQSTSVLSELYLNGVGLASLPDDIISLEVLEILDCSNNELQWLPDTFSKLTRLRVLVLSRNKLLYLPEDFGSIKTLEELWLNHNQLGDLPSSLSDLKNLILLDLYSNNFEVFPSSLEPLLNKLSGLDLEYNYFDLKSVVQYYPYRLKNLRDALCKHSRRVCFLQPGQKHSSSVEDDSQSNEDLDYSPDNESTCSLNENAEEEAVPLEEENWDLDNDDDYFDPNCMPARKIDLGPRRALIIHEVVLSPHSFCPSDIHPSPSIRPDKKNPLAADKGQFEDAE